MEAYVKLDEVLGLIKKHVHEEFMLECACDMEAATLAKSTRYEEAAKASERAARHFAKQSACTTLADEICDEMTRYYF